MIPGVKEMTEHELKTISSDDNPKEKVAQGATIYTHP